MKKTIIKIVALTIFSSLLIAFPLKLCFDAINKYIQYDKLCKTEYLNLGEDNETELFTVFYGKDAKNNAQKYIREIKENSKVVNTHTFNTNTNLITYLFTNVTDLKYKTVVEQVASRGSTPINYRRLVTENAEGFEVSNNGTLWNDEVLNIGSYEIPEMFVKSDHLQCKEGRYPDFDLKYNKGDTVEIMVTDGLGLNIGDTCFIALDAIDKNDELVVTKAEVVGIASKGIFLPYYDRYFSGEASTVNEAYNRVFNGEMIYYPDLSNFYVYNSHFKPEEEEVNDKTTVTIVLVEETGVSDVSEIAKKYDGTLISQRTGLLNATKNIYNLTTFVNYDATPYFESLSIAQTELYLTASLLVFIFAFVISVICKIIGIIKKHKI